MPQIKNWLNGDVVLEYEGDLSTALVQAVNDGKILSRANLSGADLSGADLAGDCRVDAAASCDSWVY